MADEPVIRMQPWCLENTQVIDSAQQKFVNAVTFGSEVRILATTLPQFNKTTIATTAVKISSRDSAFSRTSERASFAHLASSSAAR